MKLCITSDIHLGDSRCQLVSSDGGVIKRGPLYKKFIDAVGRDNNYLVLAGDILDFSISDYANSYACATKFFEFIRDDHVVISGAGRNRGIIYICGNHDGDLWHILQHQRSVVRKLESNDPNDRPEEFSHSAAGIIDARNGGTGGELMLDRVSLRMRNNVEQYGGLFFDHVTNPPTTFSFAYPNLYFVDDDRSVLITHGQYFEPTWAFLGEVARIIAEGDLAQYPLDPKGGGEMERMVELNFPFNQLLCTGIGQAGVLTKLARSIEHEVANGDLARIDRYLDNAIGKIASSSSWIPAWIMKLILKGPKKELLKLISKANESHFKEDFMKDQDVRGRFKRYYKYCLSELESINARERNKAQQIPPPAYVIFGHTHDPVALNSNKPEMKMEKGELETTNDVLLFNTGGWVREEHGFHGADIFTYETGKGLLSIPVRE